MAYTSFLPVIAESSDMLGPTFCCDVGLLRESVTSDTHTIAVRARRGLALASTVIYSRAYLY